MPELAGQLPEVFVIGAMKAATTTLCHWLDAQPGLAMSTPKEPGIFVSDSALDAWRPRISELYAGAQPGDLRAEGSTDYTKLPVITGVPARLHQHVPDARLVYVMRHPLERCLSQYRFEWLLEGHSLTFQESLAGNPGLRDFSRYAYQLGPWLDVFGAESILLLFAEELARDPEAQVRRVLDFLGRPSEDVTGVAQRRSNDSDQLVRKTRLRALLRDSSLGEAVRPFLPEGLARAYRRSLVRRSQADVPPAIEAELVAGFDADLVELSRLTDGPPITCATWRDVAQTWIPVLRAQ